MMVSSPPAIVQPAPPSAGARLVFAAHRLMARITDNRYAFTPEIDPQRGVFHADCSDLIDYLALKVRPDAIAALPRDPGHDAPRAWNFYSYFMAQPLVGQPARGPWLRVGTPGALLPGDVVAWKNTHYVPHESSTGHVMLVSDMPRVVKQAGAIAGYELPVIDATASGHGPTDPRHEGRSGLGQGTVYLPVTANGEAAGFAWSAVHGAHASTVREPSLAFGRLLDPTPGARL